MTTKCPCCAAEIDITGEAWSIDHKQGPVFIGSLYDFECANCFGRSDVTWIITVSELTAEPNDCGCCDNKTCEEGKQCS